MQIPRACFKAQEGVESANFQATAWLGMKTKDDDDDD